MKLTNTWAIVLFITISLVVFVIDMITPLGFAAWAGYLISLAIVYWLLKPEETYILTTWCTIFIIIAFFYSPKGLTEELAIVNRIIAIGVLWEMAYMIEKRKKAERAAAFHSYILAHIIEPVFAFDINYKIIYWNTGCENLYNIPASEAMGKELNGVLRFKWLNKNDEADRRKALKEEGEWKGSLIHHSRDGREILVESTITTLLSIQGDTMGHLAVIYDITERTTKDAIIKKDLLEKEVLLREIHHRVKNNMQIISSLLHLQTQSLTDQKSINSLEDSQARIRAMSLVHEKLYAAADIKQVDFEAYIRDLINVIVKLYKKNTDNINVKIKIEEFPIEPDTVIILGLIINEFLSNTFKYAFPDGQRGEIFVSLKNEDSEIKLIFRDNGIGIPREIDIRNTDSLGLQIVNALASQLKGEIKLNRNKGTEFILNFVNKPAKQYYSPS